MCSSYGFNTFTTNYPRKGEHTLMSNTQIKLDHNVLKATLLSVFNQLGFNQEHSNILAQTHTQSTMFGVNSHGINRVPLFAQYVKDQVVSTTNTAVKTESFGAIERWDGEFGSGILNATICTDRAIALAKNTGLGLVALKNTNHWMRAGTYGLKAAQQGCIGIMFTNTQANMPPWGGKRNRIGNNPLVIAVPNKPYPVVLDMALSQYSFGKVHQYQMRKQTLPFPGGWNAQHQATTQPDEIMATEQAMPVGYWKGSALSMVLDMLATLLAAGDATCHISDRPIETGVSQVFMCIDTHAFGQPHLQQQILDDIIEYTTSAPCIAEDDAIYYPGQRAYQQFEKSKSEGVVIDTEIWQQILAL